MGMDRPRQERFNWPGLVGEGSCLGGKASWGWATKKGAAKVRCVASSTCDVIEQCTLYVCPWVAELSL